MTCKGIANGIMPSDQLTVLERKIYSAGQKKCVICEIFIIIWMKCGVHAVAADSPKPKNTADRRRKGCYGFVKCFFKQVATGSSCTLSVAML